MEFSQVLALGVFSSYFLIILGLFYLIIKNLPASNASRISRRSAYVFVALTLASFAHTWFYMFKFMAWSFTNYEHLTAPPTEPILDRIASWLANTALFEQAWASVCFGPINWWWSEQLCLFTVGSWTVFLATEGRQHQIKYLWAYMLLGQVVAISVASNLFYLALTLSQTSPPPKRHLAPLGLWMGILLSLITIGISPFTTERTFLPNLLVMHALIVIPLIPSIQRITDRLFIRIPTLYALVLIVALGIRVRTIMEAASSLHEHAQSPMGLLVAAWEVLHSHPAQSSIGWDVIWTSISFIVWISMRPARKPQASKFHDISYLLVTSPLASVGLTAPYILREGIEDTKEE